MSQKRFDGPVIVVESAADPGDMGEPREFWSDEDKADVLVVPAARLWPHGLSAFDEPEDQPVMVKIKDGWAAVGEGWAVFAELEPEARHKFDLARRLHAQIAARPAVCPMCHEPGAHEHGNAPAGRGEPTEASDLVRPATQSASGSVVGVEDDGYHDCDVEGCQTCAITGQVDR